MHFEQTVMRVLIKIDGEVLFESGLEFSFKISYKLRHPAVIFVVFLTVTDENIVLVSFNQRGHIDYLKDDTCPPNFRWRK